MAEIIGVRFKHGGKIYYFRPNNEELEVGCHVIVETVRGTECGEMVMDRREIDDGELNREIKTIIRKATKADLQHMEDNKAKAKKAFEICSQKIKAHKLEMNLLEAEYTFDNSKIIFNFSAEGRVDFRELVKDLAGAFRARIELRQIGVRDEAKMLGGLGVCGRPFCCKQFMGDFQSVSIKMAKEQGLSLNPVKISGTCGRLMCCLKHEQDTYEDLMRMMPQVGATVVTPEGEGVVTDRELVAGKVKVKLSGSSEAPPKTFRITELKDFGGCKCYADFGTGESSVHDDVFEADWSLLDEPMKQSDVETDDSLGHKGGRGGNQRRGGTGNSGNAGEGGDSRRADRRNPKRRGGNSGGKNEPRREEGEPRRSENRQGENRRPKGGGRPGGNPRPKGGKGKPHYYKSRKNSGGRSNGANGGNSGSMQE